MKSNADRLTDLEMQLAHLQRDYDLLNQVVTEQATEMSQMAKHVRKLEQMLDSLKHKQDSMPDPLDDRPPHY